jgi:hypothetical protein
MKKIFYLIFIISVQSQTYCQSLQALVEAEFSKCKTFFKESGFELDIGNLRLDEGLQSHIDYQGDVVISLRQLEEYTGAGNIEFKKLFVRFVINHEVAHKYQIKMMKHQRVNEAHGEVVEFLECNADMLAGFFMTQLMNMVDLPELMKNPLFDLTKYNNGREEFMYSVYNSILEMYAASKMISSHPSNEDRRLSLRQGMLIGNLSYMQLLLSDPEARSKLTSQQVQQYKGTVDLLQRGLNYDPARGPLIWAHEESIRIVGENNSLCQHMVIFDNHVEWHKSADDPTVDFSFKVMNLNPNKVRFAGRVTTEVIQRNKPLDVVVTAPVDGFIFDRPVMPNEVIEISGKLEWAATEKFMPRIILPIDEEGLYWTFNFDKPETDPRPRKRYSKPEVNGPIEDREVTDLLSYLWNNRNDLRSFVEGVGHSFARSADRVTKGKIYYRSQFTLRAEDPGIIRYDQCSKRIVCSFNIIESLNYEAVNKRYDEIVKAIISDLPQLTSEAFPEEDKSKFTQFSNENIKWAEITMDYDADKKTYSLSATFFGKTEG